jgi:hypothetical protein
MTSLLLAFLSMLTLGYFASRGLLRTGLFPQSGTGLVMVHAVTAAVLVVLVLLIKLPSGGYSHASFLPTIFAQAVLFAIDRARNRLPQPRT